MATRLTRSGRKPKPAVVNDRVRQLRALALLVSLALGNVGMVALAFPAEAAPLCHEMVASEQVGTDVRCQWASPTTCCDALSEVQAGPDLDGPALAPGFEDARFAPAPTHARLAFGDPAERVPLPARSPILRL